MIRRLRSKRQAEYTLNFENGQPKPHETGFKVHIQENFANERKFWETVAHFTSCEISRYIPRKLIPVYEADNHEKADGKNGISWNSPY